MRNVVTVVLCLALLITGAQAENLQSQSLQAGKEFKQADKELTALYVELLDLQDKDGKAALVTSQKTWVAYRDAETAFKTLRYKGKPEYAMHYTRAMTVETRERIGELAEHKKA